MSTARKIDTKKLEEANPEPVEPQLSELERAKRNVLTLSSKEVLGPDFDEAVVELINAAAKEALMLKEEISVYYPEQLFSPVPYNSFRCGNIWYKTVVLPGETEERAYKRAWAYIDKIVRDQYTAARKDFWDRYNSMTI